MKKILFFAIALVASVLAFTSCNGNNPDDPKEQPLNPAELVHTMWRADSVFISGEKSPGPPAPVVILFSRAQYTGS